MKKPQKPENIDFSAMEKKLRELGIDNGIEHLSENQTTRNTPTTSKSSSTSTSGIAPAPRTTSVARTKKMAEQARQVPQKLAIKDDTERLPSDWCNYVFGTLLSIYESTWIKSYGGRPTGRFLDFADSLTEEELMRIIQHCRERLQAGETWPPIMGELTILKSQPTGSELMDAQMRVINKEPQNPVEKWIIQNKGFELRRLPQSQLARRFKEFYLEATKLQEKGKLRTEMPKALAPHSVKNLNDQKLEEYVQTHGRQINPRIQQIIDSKKDTE
ncbi:hypothetical protein R3X26_08875 [Vibrio sp. TH_r3]|uniref:hypothetical protein n=1 Tax=Vibrio sp. TH_r3 TaxID=3082084 RepID=UPI002954FA7E|nr:hypothetical protein [Vibrio sp. TH_r3]MDV7104515.1 hypothetical protein [Vibrio sp. TH_r3]